MWKELSKMVSQRENTSTSWILLVLQFQGNLPLSFWVDWILTSIYLINLLPTLILNNKSPDELLFSSKPTYSHFKVSGCLCFASTLSQNLSKFNAKVRKCVFIGYPTGVQGYYKLYDLETHSIFISRDVIFTSLLFHSNKEMNKIIPKLCLLHSLNFWIVLILMTLNKWTVLWFLTSPFNTILQVPILHPEFLLENVELLDIWKITIVVWL